MKGCGTTCGCPKISNREHWTYLENVYTGANMLREGWFSLEDFTDSDWALVSDVMRQERYLQDLYKRQGEELDKLMGGSRGSRKGR